MTKVTRLIRNIAFKRVGRDADGLRVPTPMRFALFVLALLVPGLTAAAQEAPPAQVTIPQLVFPVAGPYTPGFDNFGACRDGCSRPHEGVDIMSPKMTPVVAVADGVVTAVRGLDAKGSPDRNVNHQWLVIQHDGWQTRYLHLNNDTEGTDDGLGLGIAPDIVDAWVKANAEGAGKSFRYPVEAGQLIGWVGDSGNAENSGSHLHFELRIGEGWGAVAIDPHPHLTSSEAVVVKTWNGFFADDDGNTHEKAIDALAEQRITRGCNPPQNTKYCPERHMTRGQVAAFIRRTLSLPASDRNYFTDDDNSVFDGDINALMAAGIGFGCSDTAFCPDAPLIRDEMAQMLVNAFAAGDPDRYSNAEGRDYFVDDDGNRFESAIDRLMAADVTRGCNPPDNDRYCPDRPLTRAEMASFFYRALYGG